MPVSKKRKKKTKEVMGKGSGSFVRYICTGCGNDELIALKVVKTFDGMDQSSIDEPPQFDCESCGALMRPEHYVSVYGKVFEYKKDSD